MSGRFGGVGSMTPDREDWLLRRMEYDREQYERRLKEYAEIYAIERRGMAERIDYLIKIIADGTAFLPTKPIYICALCHKDLEVKP